MSQAENLDITCNEILVNEDKELVNQDEILANVDMEPIIPVTPQMKITSITDLTEILSEIEIPE